MSSLPAETASAERAADVPAGGTSGADATGTDLATVVSSALTAPTVLVYSSDPQVRARVRAAVGHRPDPQVGPIDWVEVADGKACVAAVDAGGIDVAVLDGEAWPTGGMGIARQLRDEIDDPPGTILLVARRDDRWLATWSRADVVLPHPVDPFALTDAVLSLLRSRAAAPAPAPPPVRKAFGIRVHEPQ